MDIFITFFVYSLMRVLTVCIIAVPIKLLIYIFKK